MAVRQRRGSKQEIGCRELGVAQQVKMLAFKSDNLSSISMTYLVEGKNYGSKVILYPPYAGTHTHFVKTINKQNQKSDHTASFKKVYIFIKYKQAIKNLITTLRGKTRKQNCGILSLSNLVDQVIINQDTQQSYQIILVIDMLVFRCLQNTN